MTISIYVSVYRRAHHHVSESWKWIRYRMIINVKLYFRHWETHCALLPQWTHGVVWVYSHTAWNIFQSKKWKYITSSWNFHFGFGDAADRFVYLPQINIRRADPPLTPTATSCILFETGGILRRQWSKESCFSNCKWKKSSPETNKFKSAQNIIFVKF